MRRRPLLAVLLLVAATCDRSPEASGPPVAPSSPTASPTTTDAPTARSGPWILFHSDPAGDSRLSVMRPDGSSLSLLTEAVAGHPFGAWSPDGSRVAFLSGSSGWGRPVVASDDGTEVVVTDLDVSLPDWSPDGTRLAFEAVEGGIYTARADGSGLRLIAEAGSGPVWSPDGSRIAFFSHGPGGFDVSVMDADGSDGRALTDAAGDDVAPAWSPDGDRIAFVSDRNGETDLYVVEVDGSGERRLTHDPAPDEAFAWSPDGERIAFVSYRDGAEPGDIGIGDAEVFVVRVRDGRIRNLSRDPAWDGDPAWSPDGRWIAFTRRTDHGEIHVMRADGSGQRMLEGLPGNAVNDCCPRWRPQPGG